VALKSGLKSIVECHISQKAHKIVRFHLSRECLTFDTRRDNVFDFPSTWPNKQQNETSRVPEPPPSCAIAQSPSRIQEIIALLTSEQLA
jgi:hypothetical protein